MYIGKDMKKMMITELKSRGYNSIKDVVYDDNETIEQKFWDIVELINDMESEILELNELVNNNNR